MILPSKHLNFSGSLLGLGSYILTKISEEPLSIDELWLEYSHDSKNGKYYASHSFDNLILTLLFLYSINTITEVKGVIYRCD